MITRDQLKKGVAYRVINSYPDFSDFVKGDIVYMIKDDGTNNLLFSKNKTHKYQEEAYWIEIENLELAEPEKESMQTGQ